MSLSYHCICAPFHCVAVPFAKVRLAQPKFSFQQGQLPYVKVSGRLQIWGGSSWSSVCSSFFDGKYGTSVPGDDPIWAAEMVQSMVKAGAISAASGCIKTNTPLRSPAPSHNSAVACYELGYRAMEVPPGDDIVALPPGAATRTICCSGAVGAFRIESCNKMTTCPSKKNVQLACRINIPNTKRGELMASRHRL